LTEVVVPARYLEPGVHLTAERPTLRLNSKGELVQVTFNNYDRAPFLLDDDAMRRFYHAYGLFHRHVMDQDNWLKIPLRPGTALIFDNWRNLHGRMGYVGKRVFCGCYTNRAELDSKLRVLRAAT
jgi:trimethyllysine dioxygenase